MTHDTKMPGHIWMHSTLDHYVTDTGYFNGEPNNFTHYTRTDTIASLVAALELIKNEPDWDSVNIATQALEQFRKE